MLLFGILFMLLIVLILVTVLVIGLTGSIGIVLFSEVIVCIVIIAWLLKKQIKKLKKQIKKLKKRTRRDH